MFEKSTFKSNIANDNVEICEDMNEKNENNTQRLQNAIVSDTESVVGNMLEEKIENNNIAGLNDKFGSARPNACQR